MPSLDISALAAKCRVTPEVIYQILEQAQVLFDTPQTINAQITVYGSSNIPATSTLVINNPNLYKTLKGMLICSASCVVNVNTPSMVLGHSIFRDGLDAGQFGTWSGEVGWNALFSASDDRVLPPICLKVDVPPSTTTTLVHNIDVNAGFTTGTAYSKYAESRTMVFLGGY